MNTLSWLIYVAEVSERASSLFGLLAFMFPLIGGVGIILLFAMSYDEDVGLGKWIPWTALPVALVIEATFLVGAVALPSKATIYMIAASEAGETVVTSPDAIEMMGDLKAIIKKRLKSELSE